MKSITKCIITVFLVTIAVSQLSCKKNDPKPVKISLAFSDKALQYVKLTEGKYFIYKNSANANPDSVVVTESYVINVLTPENLNSFMPAYYHESFKLTLSKFTSSSSSVWLTGIADIHFSYFPSDTVALDLREPVGLQAFYLSESDQPGLNIVVEGRAYSNVVLTISEIYMDISHPQYKKTSTYWAKGIGVIKREVITTGGASITYSLLRNN